MFDKLVAGLLTSYLGEYFENIDTEQVKVSVWAGNVNLKRLTVRKDALRFFNVPFCIEHGFIDELVVVIPWTRLQSESVVIKMKGVRVVVRQKTYDNYSLAQRRKDADVRRQRDLEANEAILLEEHFQEEKQRAEAAGGVSSPSVTAPSQSEEDRKNSTFSARLRANILNNIKVEMEDLQVQYEHIVPTDAPLSARNTSATFAADGSSPASVSLAFRLASLETFPCNSAYQKTFIASSEGGKLRMMHKMVVVNGVQVVLLQGTQPDRPLTASLNAALRMQYQPITLDRRAPTCLIGAQLDALSASASQEDVQLLYTLVRGMCTPSEDDWDRLKMRPLVNVHHAPRAWWRYAVDAVRLSLRKARQRTTFSWEAYKAFKAQRDTYARLYRRSRRGVLGAEKWLNPLSAQEEVDLLNLEEKLPVETIKLARRLALARVTVERQEYTALRAQQMQQRHAKASEAADANTSASPTATPQPSGGPASDPPSSGNWLKRWWSSAPSPSVERAIENEESPEVRAVMQETVELMSTTKWTEAQRLAIAKELGYSPQEANAMAEVGSPTANAPALSPATEAGPATSADGDVCAQCTWKAVLCFTSATIRLTQRVEAAEKTFAAVQLQGVSVGATAWDDGRVESVFCVHDLGVRGANQPLIYLCTDASAAATPRMVPTVSQQREHSEWVLAKILQDMDASLLAIVQRPLRADGQSKPGLFLWSNKEPQALLKRDEAAHHVHLTVEPIGVNVDVPFLHELVQFFLAAYRHVQDDQQVPVANTAAPRLSETLQETHSHETANPVSDATVEENAYIRAEMGISAQTLRPAEARDIADPQSCLASLKHKVERAWVVDWSVSLGGITLLVLEVDGEQGSRIHARDVEVAGDVQRQLRRAARFAAAASSGSAGVSPSTAGTSRGFPVITESPLGEEETDWLDLITARVGEYSLSSLFAASPGVSEATWHTIVEPIAFQYELTRNLLPRRHLKYPNLAVTIASDATLHVHLSRSRLSVLCTSLSFLIDFVQRTMREIMMTTTETPTSTDRTTAQEKATAHGGEAGRGGHARRFFRARVLCVDKRCCPPERANDDAGGNGEDDEDAGAEEAPSTTETYLQAFHPAPLQPLEYRCLNVRRGALTIFHAMRPSYPQYCIELIKGHYHVRLEDERHQPVKGGAPAPGVIVSLFVEQGGAAQSTANLVRKARAAKVYLGELFRLPPAVFANATLLRPFVQSCLAAVTSGVSSSPQQGHAETVEEALQAVEAVAHLVPCQHVRVRFDDAEAAREFAQSLRTSGISRGLFTPSLDDFAALKDAVPEALRSHCAVRVAAELPSCVVDLCEEKMPDHEQGSDIPPGPSTSAQESRLSTAQWTIVPCLVSVSQGIQWMQLEAQMEDIRLSVGEEVLCACLAEPSTTPRSPRDESMPTEDAAGVQVTATLETVPHSGLLPSRKATQLTVLPGHVLTVHLTSHLLQMAEMMWDMVGIATNRLFSATVVPCTPWWPADASARSCTRAEEDAWVAAASCAERRQQHVRANLARVHCDVSLPDTTDEWSPALLARDALSHAQTPLITFSASDMNVEWCLDAAQNRTHCTFQSPVIKARSLASMAPTPRSTTACHLLGTDLLTLCAPTATNSTASCAIDVIIPTVVPTVSLSDYLRGCPAESEVHVETAAHSDTALGYRFTNAFTLKACGLRMVYFQPQLMTLLEVGTRGVMERALAVTGRPAYLFGSSSRKLASAVLPAWPEQWATMPPAPFNWTVMRKNVVLQNCIVWLPRSPEAAAKVSVPIPIDTAAVPGCVFVLDLPTLNVNDELRGSTATNDASTLVGPCSVEMLTRIRLADTRLKSPVASITETGSRLTSSNRLCQLTTLCGSLTLEVLLTQSLFDAAAFVNGKRRESELRLSPTVWHADATNYAEVVQGLSYQFMDRPLASPFAPKPTVVVDPFVEASLAVTAQPTLKDVSHTVVSVAQCCLHVCQSYPAARRRDRINTAAVLKALQVSLLASSDKHSQSEVALGEASVWDLSHLSAADDASFDKDPAEVCDGARAFLRLLPVPTKVRSQLTTPDKAVVLRYTVRPGFQDVDAALGVLQLTVVPHFLFDARDGFFSLAMRDAVGRVLSWPPYTRTGTVPSASAEASSPPVPQPTPVGRCWHLSLGQLRLSLPDVLHNSLNPFLLFSVAGIDMLDETDAMGNLKEQHLVVAQLTRNGMYVYPNELSTSASGPALTTPKLRVLVMPAVPMRQLSARAVAPPGETAASRGAQSAGADLMDALFGSPPSTCSQGTVEISSTPSAPVSPERDVPSGPVVSLVNTPPNEEDGGLVVHVAPVWFVVPHRHHVAALSTFWSQGGLGQLTTLSTFLEDRQNSTTVAIPVAAEPPASVRPSLFPRIRVTVDTPALVLPDRESNPGSAAELQRGMLLTVGTIQFEKDKQLALNSPTTAVEAGEEAAQETRCRRVWRLRVPHISLCAISQPDEALLQPFSVALERWDDEPTAWGWRLHVEKVSLTMEKRYYEMLLQTMVRNMITAASAGAGRRTADAAHALDFEGALRWCSTGVHTGHAAPPPAQGASSNTKADDGAVGTSDYLYATAEDELGLRHPFPAYDSLEEERGALSGVAGGAGSHPMRVFHVQLRMDGIELCVFDADTAAYLRVADVDLVSNAEWHLLSGVQDNNSINAQRTLPFSAPQRFLLQGHARLVDRRRQVTARVGRVELGLRDRQPLLLLVSSPVRHSIEDPTAVDVSAAVYVSLIQKNLEETVEGHLGDGTLRLDSNTVATAIDFLYRPYARIVLPSYEVGEVMVLTRDRTLTAPLYLSQRATLRVSGVGVNHITLNAAGNEIHFMDENAQGDAGAVVFVDEGVTLRVVNAILCFHGNSLDYYVTAGNGGYVVVDRESCSTVSAEDAAVTAANVRDALISATTRTTVDVMDSLFGPATEAEPASTSDTRAVATTASNIPARVRRLRRYIVAASLRAEVPEPLYMHRTSPGDAPSRTLSRTLVLTATLHCCLVDIQQGGKARIDARLPADSVDDSIATEESDSCTGTFDLSNFAVHSESYLQTSQGGTTRSADSSTTTATQTERTDLLSEWAVQVLYTKTVAGGGGTTHAYDVVAKKGLDMRIRYRDLFMCAAALQQAQHALSLALGDVKAGAFSDVVGTHSTKGDQGRDVLRTGANAARAATATADASSPTAITATVNVEVAYCHVFLVDDKSSVDLPLFHFRVDHILTPACTSTLEDKQWSVQMALSVEFYDVRASSWYPWLEPVAIEVNMRQVASLSMDELMRRKGFRRLEVKVKPVRVYVSPLLLGAVRRAIEVREAFQREQAQLELYGPERAAATTIPSAVAHADPATPAATSPARFYAVSVRQDLGVKAVHVGFPPSFAASALAGGYDVEAHAECAFDYPRVAGKEAERGQQYILVSVPPDDLVQRVYTFADGVAQVPLGRARLARHPIVEVSAVHGRKEVLLRTNISFVNNLSYPVMLEGGVGCVPCRGRTQLHVPIAALRQRIRFLPNVDFKCDDCSLGIRYENLPALRGRTFLCVCPVELCSDGSPSATVSSREAMSTQVLLRTDEYELRRSMQRHLFFFLRVRDAPHRGAAALEDVVGHFDAPLYVVNHTGLPLELLLMTRRTVQEKKLGILDIGTERFVYDWVARVTVDPATSSTTEKASRQDITQVDPFQEIAMDVVVRLPHGAVVGRRLESRLSASAPRPACVYSPRDTSRRDDSVTLIDPKTGARLVLTITYESNEVHLFCPYWILNDTLHALQITDMNPEKGTALTLVAGLQPGTTTDAVVPVDAQRHPYLYSSERSMKAKVKAHVYVRVGVSSQGLLNWTRWSTAVNIYAPTDTGVVTCVVGSGVVLTLSYSVELGAGRLANTRIVTVRPRWVLVNRTPRGLSIRFATPTANNDAVAASSETTVGSASCHVFYRTPSAAAPAISGSYNNSNSSGASMGNSIDGGSGGGAACLQLRFVADSETGTIETCEWSPPFRINDEGEHAYNVRHRGLVKLADHWPVGKADSRRDGTPTAPTGAVPASLPPIRPEDIVERQRELYLRRVDTTVIHVSCVRRASTTFVVVTEAANPPFIIENRTDFMVWVRQERSPSTTSIAVYPKRTKPYTWDDEALPLHMVLLITDGTETRHASPVRINFDPRALLQGSETGFQQEVEMTTPDGVTRMLFIRVRGVHGASYAVSVTSEPTIDVYRTMPYRQFFCRLHVDAIYTVFEDAQHDDTMLLTVRPVHVEFAQGAQPRVAQKDNGAGGLPNMSLTSPANSFAGDVQRIDVSVQTVQLDDERPQAKQKVIAQIVDDTPTYGKYERYMLRSTPVLYVPKCVLFASPIEFHVEDSFLYDIMQYGELMKDAWSGVDGSSANGSRTAHANVGAIQTSVSHGWMEEVALLSELAPIISGPAARRGARTTPSWQQRVVFFGRLFIEKLLVSISLYRSPGAQNDPIWERVGALSLLLRSVKDARLEWSRIDQRNLSEVIWVLLTKYSAFYRRRLQEQIPSLINIVGIDNVKGFFTKLVDDPAAEREAVRRQKPRVPRRKEASLLKDSPAYKERLRDRRQLVVQVEQRPSGAAAVPEPFSATRLVEQVRQRSLELVGPRGPSLLDMPFAQLLRQLTSRNDLLLFGNAAIRLAIVSSAPSVDVSNVGTRAVLRGAEHVVGTQQRSSENPSFICRRCGEVESLEQQYTDADMPFPLPHPDEGIITWPEFVHHVTWDAFVAMCAVPEVQQYGPLVKDAILGHTSNVVRLVT